MVNSFALRWTLLSMDKYIYSTINKLYIEWIIIKKILNLLVNG